MTHIPFPRNATFTAFGENNAFAVLLPDKTTLVQSQPLYRCKPDTPILALRQYLVSKTPLFGGPTFSCLQNTIDCQDRLRTNRKRKIETYGGV